MSQEPITPPTQGLTPEAEQALREQGIIDHDTGSDAAEDEFNETPFPFASMEDLGEGDPGEIIEAEIVEEPNGDSPNRGRSRSRSRTDRTPPSGQSVASPRTPRDAKAGPPTLDEWQNFFSRVVLRLVTEWYLSYAFRGVDEDTLTDKELDRLAMTDDERQLISVPIAELSHKSKIMRKHGRMIVASGDALNSLVVMAAWASRVNRIAAKHRPKQPKARTVINGSSGQSEESPASPQAGANGGRIPEWFSGPIFPGSG